jgi:hypothetical protein
MIAVQLEQSASANRRNASGIWNNRKTKPNLNKQLKLKRKMIFSFFVLN